MDKMHWDTQGAPPSDRLHSAEQSLHICHETEPTKDNNKELMIEE